MSNGTDIAAEVAAALEEGSAAVGDGEQTAYVLRRGEASGPGNRPEFAPDDRYPTLAIVGSFSAMEQMGTSIEANDVKITCAVLAITPTTADKIEVSGIEYYIQQAETIRPGGVDLFHALQCRRTGS